MIVDDLFENSTDPEQEKMDLIRSGRQRRERGGGDSRDAQLRARNDQLAQYAKTGNFWLKQKDTQQHINDQPYTGKAAANAAAVEMLKQQPELRGNLVITAYGPGEQQVTEGKVKELSQDLRDKAMSDDQFKSKYGKTRTEVRAAMREKQGVAEGVVPGGEYGRVLTALNLYYPRLSIQELNTPEWHKVIANKAEVPAEYAGQVIADFVKASDPNQPEEDFGNEDEPGIAEASKRQPEADYGGDYQAMVGRVGQMAKQGERKTVWDPVKRVYKTVPVNSLPGQNK